MFDHQSFTGRSGSFFKYEGLGSIYWHMVSKLLVAVQEVLDAGQDRPTPRDGLAAPGCARITTPSAKGWACTSRPPSTAAFPIDPYSHTPAHAGAQQPGLTGQVKEDVIARLRELGVVVDGGASASSRSCCEGASSCRCPAASCTSIWRPAGRL